MTITTRRHLQVAALQDHPDACTHCQRSWAHIHACSQYTSLDAFIDFPRDPLSLSRLSRNVHFHGSQPLESQIVVLSCSMLSLRFRDFPLISPLSSWHRHLTTHHRSRTPTSWRLRQSTETFTMACQKTGNSGASYSPSHFRFSSLP